MTTKKISELPAAATITGTEQVPVVQSGATVRTTIAALIASVFNRANPLYTGTQAQSTVTNLITDLAAKAADAAVVKLTGNQTVAGTKTFSSAPVVPDGSWAIADTTGLQAALDAKPADSAVVHDTGDETIAGTKTFSSSPIVPTPTTALQAATKAYVDTITGAAGIRIEDEGSSVVAAATGINFAGGGVTVTDAGSGEALVTINPSAALGMFYVGAATGVTVTDKANVLAAINAAKAATLGGIVQFGPGSYDVGDLEMLMPEALATGKQLILRGAGNRYGTFVRFSTDRDVGDYAIMGAGIASSAGGQYKTVLEDIFFAGPGFGEAFAAGVEPCNLSGLMLDTHTVVNRCTFSGFRNGFEAAGNHSTMYSCKSNGNYYGCYFTAATGAGGDINLFDCDLAGNNMASMAVGPTSTACWTSVLGHFGFAPYCIYLEGGRSAGQLAMVHCKFMGTSFEYMGNGFIFSADQNAFVDDCQWTGCANFSLNNATYGLPATSYGPSHIKVYKFTNCRFTDGIPGGANTLVDSTNGIGFQADGFRTSLAQAEAASVSWILGDYAGNRAITLHEGVGNRCTAIAAPAVQAIAAGELCEWSGQHLLQPRGHNGAAAIGFPAGFALNTVAAGAGREYAVVAVEGSDITVLKDGTVNPNDVLTPSSSTASHVMAVAGYDGTIATATRPVVGRMNLAVDATKIRATVRL